MFVELRLTDMTTKIKTVTEKFVKIFAYFSIVNKTENIRCS